jgi:peptidoglycan-associated lipoprotein
MRSTRFILGALGALGLLLGACGGEKAQEQAKEPEPMQSIGRTNMQPTTRTIPNTPTAANVSISPEILRDCNIPDSDAYFAFDSSELMSFDHAPLDALATCFTSGPMKGKKLSLVGHADPRGAPDYNVTLGQSRADAVASYLSERGLDKSRVTTTSRGAMDATGRTETGWAHDRRVDVMLGQ